MGRRSRTRLYTRCINNDYVTNVSALDPRTHNGVRECVCMCMCGLHNIELSILRTNFVAGGPTMYGGSNCGSGKRAGQDSIVLWHTVRHTVVIDPDDTIVQCSLIT